jgi:GDSL-like Lipase/Acylhydrolase family
MPQSLGDNLAQLGVDPSVGGLLQSSISAGSLPLFAIFGTSITDQNSRWIVPPAASPSSAWFADGYATWLRILTNQRINLPVSNDFGVSGDTFAMMQARIGTVLASKADYCIVEGGSNDISGLSTEAGYTSMVSTWLAIIGLLRKKGICPIIMPAPPRAGSVLTAQQVRYQQRFYNFQREYCRNNRGFLFVDYLGWCLDQTSATSNPLPNMVKADNLHPMNTLAFYMGKTAADIVNQLLPPRPSDVLPNADIYNVTDNPTGNLLYSGATNYGLLAGTGGTQTANANLTYSGNSSAGSTFVRGSATSVCTVTLTKENPRTDTGRASGERQIIQITANSGGGADEVYNFRFTPAIADVAAGDWYYAECGIQVTAAPVNISSLELYLLETRPSNSQTSIDLAMNSSLSGFLPTVTWSGVLRTPPIQRTSDATALQVNIRARAKTDVGAASITFAAGDYAVRKVDPSFI